MAAVALLASVALAGCGSGGKKSSGTKETKRVSIPEIANDTDLKVAPSVSPGTPPPPTTLQKKDLVVGSGAEAVAASTVDVQYYGANYEDGKEFDSSWKGGKPVTFPLGRVIPGFSQGILGMKVGGRRVVVIPPALGYGAAGSPPAVGPNETLVFVIDLVGVH
jgi:peptidylprolyl isomerase